MVADNLSRAIDKLAFFQNVYNIFDDASTNPPSRLWGALSVTTAEIDAPTYFFNGVQRDDGLTTHKIADDGTAAIYGFIEVNIGTTRYGLRGITSIEIGGIPFSYQAIANGNIVKVYHFPPGGTLTSSRSTSPGTGDVTGNGSDNMVMNKVEGSGSSVSLNKQVGVRDDATKDVNDSIALKLDVPYQVTGEKTFLFVAGYVDEGVSIFALQ